MSEIIVFYVNIYKILYTISAPPMVGDKGGNIYGYGKIY
jgi:hypothetical protein